MASEDEGRDWLCWTGLDLLEFRGSVGLSCVCLRCCGVDYVCITMLKVRCTGCAHPEKSARGVIVLLYDIADQGEPLTR